MAYRQVTDHPKFHQLMHALKLRKYEALGILEAIWHFTSSFATPGDIGRFSNSYIAQWIGWRGKPDQLIAALVETRWLDADPGYRLLIHDWATHTDSHTHAHLCRLYQTFCTGEIPKTHNLNPASRTQFKNAGERGQILPPPKTVKTAQKTRKVEKAASRSAARVQPESSQSAARVRKPVTSNQKPVTREPEPEPEPVPVPTTPKASSAGADSRPDGRGKSCVKSIDDDDDDDFGRGMGKPLSSSASGDALSSSSFTSFSPKQKLQSIAASWESGDYIAYWNRQCIPKHKIKKLPKGVTSSIDSAVALGLTPEIFITEIQRRKTAGKLNSALVGLLTTLAYRLSKAAKKPA